MQRNVTYTIEFVDKFTDIAEKYNKCFQFMERQTELVDKALDLIPKSLQAIDNQVSRLQSINIQPNVNTSGLDRFSNTAKEVIGTLGVLNGINEAVNFGNESIDFAAKISDDMASVQKTTGITKESILQFRKELQGLDTRTNLQDLFKIGEIGGQIGISEKDIKGYTRTIDMLGVAFKGEFNSIEETADRIGKLGEMFPKLINSGMPIPEILSRIGSGINELSASGQATAPYIVDFVARAAPSLKALNPETLLAFGAAMQESSMTSENAASGIRTFFGYIFKESDKFSKFMNMNKTALLGMFDTDTGTQKFLRKFAEQFNGVTESQSKLMLRGLGVVDFQGQDFIQNLITRMNLKGKENTGVDRLTELLDISKKGTTENISIVKEFDVMNNTLAANLEKQAKKYDNIKLTLGEMLIPFKLQAMELGSGILEKIVDFGVQFEQKKGLFESMAVGVGVFGGALALANIPALTLLGTQVALALTNPFALSIAGAAALGGLFTYLYNQSENFRGVLWAVFEGGKVWFEGFYNVAKVWVGGVINIFGGLADMIVGIFELDFNKLASGFGKSLEGVLRASIGTAIAGIGEGIDKTPKIFTAMNKGFDFGEQSFKRENTAPDYTSKYIGAMPNKFLELAGGMNKFELVGAKTPVNNVPMPNFLQAPKGVNAMPTMPTIPKDNSPFDFGKENSDNTNKDSSVLKNGLDTVSSGGSKPTNITINIGKLNESINITTQNMQDGYSDVEEKLKEILLRVVNDVNARN